MPIARCGLCFRQPFLEVVGVEADVVAEAVVGDAALAGLREEPRWRDAEHGAGGFGVDQREWRVVGVDGAAREVGCDVAGACPAPGGRGGVGICQGTARVRP